MVADPGNTPMFPLMTVPTVPVLVTVVPARTAKFAAVPRLAGNASVATESRFAINTNAESKIDFIFVKVVVGGLLAIIVRRTGGGRCSCNLLLLRTL